VLLVAAGIGVAVFAIYKFKDQIGAALGPVASLVKQAAGAIGEGFGPAVSDGMVVLNDLASTASTTFNGIYEAVAAGDLSGAMDILWAGLIAGWLRGVEALMSYVDPWSTAFQDVFTDIGSGIYIAWDKIYADSSAILNTMGAFVLGFFDNIANGVMATFDNLVAGIRIAWTRVQGYITGAKDTKERVQKIRDENAARAEQRMQERPGVNARVDKAAAENAQAETQRQDRVGAIMAGADGDKAARQGENARRAADRRAATVAAEGALSSLVGGEAETRAKNSQVDDLLSSIKGSTSVDQLAGAGGLGDQFSTLRDLGRLTSDQETMLSDALDKAAEGLTKTATAGATTSKAEVAGTFSSVNLGGMGFGSSLAERQLKALESIDKNTKNAPGEGMVAA
jgi:hypothetical protein